jgi:hypothetical protein
MLLIKQQTSIDAFFKVPIVDAHLLSNAKNRMCIKIQLKHQRKLYFLLKRQMRVHFLIKHQMRVHFLIKHQMPVHFLFKHEGSGARAKPPR